MSDIYWFDNPLYSGFYRHNYIDPERAANEKQAIVILGNQILLSSLVISEAIAKLSEAVESLKPKG